MPETTAKDPKRLAIAAAIVLIIIVLLVAGRKGGPGPSGKTDASLITGVTAYRVLQNGTPTGAAHAAIAFARKSSDYSFVNVAIDLDKNGSYKDYELPDKSTQAEWVVKNMPVKVMPEGDDFSFDLLDRAVDGGKDFKAVVSLTAAPLKDWTGAAPAGSATSSMTIASFEPDDFGKLIAPTSPDGTGGAPTAAPSRGASMNTKTDVKGADKWLHDASAAPAGAGAGAGEAAAVGAQPAGPVPAPNADFSVFQTDVPDMSQGVNECVPTSTSDAITWLGNRYGFKDRLPKDQKSTMEELKGDFNWTRADGVLVEPNYIPGKTSFAARHDLPIVTHQIGQKFDDDMAQNIATELAKGQAVEIVIGYYQWDQPNNKWVRHGGHMLSAVGAFGSNGSTYIGLHDPASPGANRLDVYETDKSRMLNYRYRGPYATFIEYAIAESPTQDWVTAHPPTTAIETSGGIVEARDVGDTFFVDAIKIGTAWYPVAQFYKGTGPDCDAPHWHATTGKAWGLDLGDKGELDRQPSSVNQRHAKTVEWTDPEHCGAGKIAEVELKNVMISKDEAFALAAKAMGR